MRTLGLVLLVCAACAKKPAPKTPAAPPPASETDQKASDEDDSKPAPASVQRTGDPCDGGEKPH